MSVHTLQETDTGVVIGANITKGEARDAGPQILAFCCRVSGTPMPLLIDRAPIFPGQDSDDTAIGAIGVRDGKVVIDHTCAICGNDVSFRLEPDEAEDTASHLATHASIARNAPDPAEVKRLSEFIDTIRSGVGPMSGERLAAAIVQHFEITERTP